MQDNGEKLETTGTEEVTEVKSNPNLYTHEFENPFCYEGKTFTIINFDFGKLKGKDMIAIESEMLAQSEYVLMPEISTNYHSHLAARASGVAVEIIENMPILDFKKITNAARDFLISSGY